MSYGEEVSDVKAVLAANTLVKTKGDQAQAAGTMISWAKQHLGDLPVLEGWGTGEVALVVSYLIKYQAQVAKCLGQIRMVEEAGPMLKVSMGQSLKSMEVERKGLTLRMVDKMDQKWVW
jgi:hypothetical protein